MKNLKLLRQLMILGLTLFVISLTLAYFSDNSAAVYARVISHSIQDFMLLFLVWIWSLGTNPLIGARHFDSIKEK